MTRREYVVDVWLPEHAVWLTLACAVHCVVTAPDVPGAGAQALAWLGAAAFWGGFLVVLRGLTWSPWREETPGAGNRDNVVPIRPGPDRTA
ncbi:hypothetical protein [Methylobacterium brachythecii]|uniref:Uncharacterized protein n=1 Tax=Methylobacterium brachythecii TaxID=1176177 RepID=A0A7W6AMH5_9HYPH|nr:hypothetical protein [Methylobacterium brachythecii]MBB3905323.1 hypothetical protein [Methylobacterium brachythecii]GLS45860.1 hypothetical protein GCM10007884_38510 [Methylobacterium brachythecii]